MKQFDRRIAHGEQARLACPAGQWPPLDTEVTPDGGPGIEGHVPAPPRMYGTAAAVAACHEAPGPSWHDDELGGHTYATAAESREQVTDLQPADAGALRCHDRG